VHVGILDFELQIAIKYINLVKRINDMKVDDMCHLLIPKGPKAISRPFLKFGQAIVKTIFIKNS
jgi:hypothetical protein